MGSSSTSAGSSDVSSLSEALEEGEDEKELSDRVQGMSCKSESSSNHSLPFSSSSELDRAAAS